MHETIRETQQGRGKRGDPRWIFAGKDGAMRLAHLELIKERGRADELLIDVHTRAEAQMDKAPSYATMTRVLRQQLCYSSKRVRAGVLFAAAWPSSAAEALARRATAI